MPLENLHLSSNLSYGAEEIAELRDLMLSLSKGMRASRQYPAEHPIPQQFKKSFRTHLARYFDQSDRLSLRVNIDSFEAGDEVVYRGPINNDNLAHLLHRDGIRLIEIRPSVSQSEIDALFDALVASSGQDDQRQDIVNFFWKAGFENITYEVVDSFEIGEASDMYSEFLEAEQPNRSAGGNLALTPGTNIAWSAGSSTPKLQAEENHRFMVRAFGDPNDLTAHEQQSLSAMISEDRSRDIKREVVDLLLQLCAENTGPQDMRLTLESLQSTFDRIIDDGDFGTLKDILLSVRRLLGIGSFDSPLVNKRLKEFEARCGDIVRIKLITNSLNKNTEIDLHAVEAYLIELGWESLSNLLGMLGELSHYPARKMVCDLLVKKGFEKIDILGGAVYDSRWFVARNVVWVLGEMKTLQSIPYLTKAAKHVEPRVKTEVIKALGKLGGDRAAGVLLIMLKDESEKIRSQAARELGKNATSAASMGLAEIVREKDFPDAPPAEMRLILEALVVCGGDAAWSTCEEILAKSTLFNKARLHRFQEAIVGALASSTSPEAIGLVTRLCSDSRNHIAVVARRVLSLLKNRREEK